MCSRKKPIRLKIWIISSLWLVFVIFHLSFTGKILIWNIFGNIPTFFFLLIPLIFLAAEIIGRGKWPGIFFAVFSLILGFTQSDLNLVKAESYARKSGDLEVRIINWNTCYWDQRKDKEEFYRFLKRQKADIYILQEYMRLLPDTETKGARMGNPFRICSAVPGFPIQFLEIDDSQKIQKEFPGYDSRSHNQFLIISRFPIGESRLDNSDQYAVFDINVDGRTIRLFNVHMLLHIEPQNPLKPHFFDSLPRRFAARQLGFQNLKQEIRNLKQDYLIAGDFNATKAMGVLNALEREHIDTIKYSKEMVPFTFNLGGLRLWRFDYVWLPKKSQNLKVRSHRTIDPEGLSDHDLQMLDLNLKSLK